MGCQHARWVRYLLTIGTALGRPRFASTSADRVGRLPNCLERLVRHSQRYRGAATGWTTCGLQRGRIKWRRRQDRNAKRAQGLVRPDSTPLTAVGVESRPGLPVVNRGPDACARRAMPWKPGRCWRMLYSHQLQATDCHERPAWTGWWFSPRGDRVWACPDHLDGLTGLRQFGSGTRKSTALRPLPHSRTRVDPLS